MEWQTSDFREFPKYYGDVVASEFGPYNKGVRVSAKYIAFGYSDGNSIGYVPTDFYTGISEKAAQGRRAEYGAKTYTTDKIGKCVVCKSEEDNKSDASNEPKLNNLAFNPFNDYQFASVHDSGLLNIWELPQSYSKIGDIDTPIVTIKQLSQSATCLAYHPSISNVIAVGSNDAIYVCDAKEGKIVNTVSGLTSPVAALEWLPNGSLIRAVTVDGKLLSLDPRTNPQASDIVVGDVKCTPEGLFHLAKVNPDGNVLIVIGSTGFREPIVYVWDITNMEKPLSKYPFEHKNCYAFGKYDRICNLFYVSFRTTADLIVYDCLPNGSLEKLVIYHGVKDTFVGFDTIPKNGIKKREINEVIKLAKNRVQLLPHHKGGKIIYNKITKSVPKPIGDTNDYFEKKIEDTALDLTQIAQLVDPDFEEKESRKASVYVHITGREAQGIEDRYYNILPSKTVNIPLGQNIKVNAKYCIFPSQVTGGGGLGIVPSVDEYTGRQKQGEIRCHSDSIATFDITQCDTNLYESSETLVATGASDAKVYISKIPDNLFDGSDPKNKNFCNSKAEVKQISELQHEGKVSFVGFHPRIGNLLITADKAMDTYKLRLWDVAKGTEVIENGWSFANGMIMDVAFEPVFGLLAAVSSQDKFVRIVDIKNQKVLFTFESLESKRDVKLTWIRDSTSDAPYYTRLMTLGFGQGSVRRFSVWDIEDVVSSYYKGISGDSGASSDEKDEKSEISSIDPVMTTQMSVSNSIPINYYDPDTNLVYISSVGDLKIRVYELNHKNNTSNEMNQAFTSKMEILGVGYKLKQLSDVKTVEMIKAYKFCKNDISPISFYVPRKRFKEYFQDDLYVPTLDYTKCSLTYDDFIAWMNDGNASSMPKVVTDNSVSYIDLTPTDMEKLSNAPPEADSVYTKRRKSQLAQMEAEKLKSQPQSTEQAMEAFSRMVADAPTANRWDAVNIGTEVNEDEWSD